MAARRDHRPEPSRRVSRGVRLHGDRVTDLGRVVSSACKSGRGHCRATA